MYVCVYMCAPWRALHDDDAINRHAINRHAIRHTIIIYDVVGIRSNKTADGGGGPRNSNGRDCMARTTCALGVSGSISALHRRPCRWPWRPRFFVGWGGGKDCGWDCRLPPPHSRGRRARECMRRRLERAHANT